MAAMDFPSSPTNGQVYGNYVYSTSKGAWQARPVTSEVAVISPTAPSNPKAGDIWYNSDDGCTYVYYYDGDSYQWVASRNDATFSSTLGPRLTTLEQYPSGLVPIVPTSVTVGSGSATVNATGMITYTGASSLNLNGLFTSAYPNYRIVFQHILSTDTGLNLRLRVGGVDNTSAVYNNHHVYWGPGGNGVNIIANHTVFGSIFGHGKQRGAYEINAPQVALRTGITFFGVAENAAGSTEQHTSSAMHKADTQFDGVTIYPTGGTFAGTVQVYGYRQDYIMALNFPGSPVNGQSYQGFVYNSAVGAWQSNPASVAPFYTADTPPTNPTKGDSWFNTNDGTMYIYTYDGNTYQWVEHRSEIARSQVGLVPLVPGSITVGTGTATVNNSGEVAFTGVTSIALNNIFTTTYSKYRYVIDVPTSSAAAATLQFRFRSGTTDNSTNIYNNYWAMSLFDTGAFQSNNGTNTMGSITSLVALTNRFVAGSGDIINPMKAISTDLFYQGFGYNSARSFLLSSGINFDGTATFDGINFICGSGTMTGTVKVYGYN